MEEIHLCKADIDDIKKKIPVYLICSSRRNLKDRKYSIKSTNIVVELKEAESAKEEAILSSLMASRLAGFDSCVIEIKYHSRLVKPKKIK